MIGSAAYRRAFRRDVAALATAARQDLKVPVPSCPGWSVAILLAHLCGLYLYSTALARTRATSEIEPCFEHQGLSADLAAFVTAISSDSAPLSAQGAPPPGLLDFFVETAATLDEALLLLEPSTPLWSWCPSQQTAGFWQRRMTHETAIHRWDTERAYGTPTPLETQLATDGVDEYMTVIVPGRPLYEPAGHRRRGAGEVFQFRRTDGPGAWCLRCDPEGPTLTADHGVADLALSGTASDLLLWLWQRISADTLEVVGDAALLRRYFELIPPG